MSVEQTIHRVIWKKMSDKKFEPLLIIIGGMPGAGKTTLSEALSKKMNIAVFNKDELEAALVRRNITQVSNVNGIGYELLATLAEKQLKLGHSVILDSVASSVRADKFWKSLLTHKYLYIECICSKEELHKERIEARKQNIPGWYEMTWSDVEKVKLEYLPFSDDRVVIDSIHALDHNLDLVVERIHNMAAR